ncbi:MAG: hypothetical protein NC925_05715 [Candidatus Omnitrophica bacterium]|nr:hypothetical protein [Candidatus Omnitrophota bacterium]MCM8831482.1 hypothetical protein [Candidatus Omnitrophota bacterium]
MTTLRKLFHDLANKQNLVTIGTDATVENLKDLQQENLTQDLKEQINKILSDIEKIQNGISQLNQLVSQIKERVYKITNPDEEF